MSYVFSICYDRGVFPELDEELQAWPDGLERELKVWPGGTWEDHSFNAKGRLRDARFHVEDATWALADKLRGDPRILDLKVFRSGEHVPPDEGGFGDLEAAIARGPTGPDASDLWDRGFERTIAAPELQSREKPRFAAV